MAWDWSGNTRIANESFKKLSKFYRVNGTLPLSEEKNIIALFRKMIAMDNFVEELAKTLALQSKINQPEQKQEEEKKEEMEMKVLKIHLKYSLHIANWKFDGWV